MFFEAYPFQNGCLSDFIPASGYFRISTEVDLQDAIAGFLPIPIHGVAI